MDNDLKPSPSTTEECAICQEALHDGEKATVTLPCKHSYCSDCLEGWRSKFDSTSGRTCPQCRQKIPPTKEMVNQLQMMKKSRDMAKAAYEKHADEPRKALAFPVFEDLEEVVRNYAMVLPEDQHDKLISEGIKSRIEAYERQVEELEKVVGDVNPEDLLVDPNAPNVLDLPFEICLAAMNNNVKDVLEWLGEPPVPKERIDAKTPQKMYRTLLHEAEYENSTGLMSLLLQLGASVDPQSSTGMTPLGQACMNLECEPAARLLLEWGAQIEEMPGQEEPCWKLAAEAGNHTLSDLMKTPLGGRRCEIVNLKQRSDLNGLTGVAAEYIPTAGRYVVKVEQSQELIRVRPANLKRRDRTQTDPGVYYHFMGQTSSGENQFLPGLMVSSDEEAERYQEMQKKQMEKLQQAEENVPDLSKPVGEIRVMEVDSGNYSLCMDGNELDLHLDMFFDEQGSSTSTFPAIDLAAGLGVQTVLFALRFREPAYRATLEFFSAYRNPSTTRSGFNYLANEAMTREALFRDAEDEPVFANDAVLLKGLSTTKLNGTYAKVLCQDPDQADRYAVRLFSEKGRLEKKRMSIKRQNLFAAPSAPTERKALLAMSKDEVQNLFVGLQERIVTVDVNRSATWSSLGHLFGKCALVCWMPPADDRSSQSGWKQSLELAYRLLAYGGCFVQLDKHQLFDGNGFGNLGAMEPYVQSKGLTMIIESFDEVCDHDKGLAMVLWKKVPRGYDRMAAMDKMVKRMMERGNE